MSDDPTTPGTEPVQTAGSTTADAAATETSTPGSFTQAHVERIAGEARKAGRQAGLNELLRELGVETPDALKATIAEAKKAREAQMTEAERTSARIAELEKAATDAAALKAQADGYGTAVSEHVDRLIKQANLPKAVKELVEKLSPLDRLTWWTKHAEELSKPTALPNLNGGESGRGKPHAMSNEARIALAAELGVKPEFLPQ